MSETRRKSRELALQFLYQHIVDSEFQLDEALRRFEANFGVSREGGDTFSRTLIFGVLENVEVIDASLKQALSNWRPERLSPVDRALLRLGTYELLFRDEIPATVTLNEMVELAKHFGSENSGGFVNGVLDAVRKTNPRPDKLP